MAQITEKTIAQKIETLKALHLHYGRKLEDAEKVLGNASIDSQITILETALEITRDLRVIVNQG